MCQTADSNGCVLSASACCAAGGNLHDIVREEEAKAAAARAAQPANVDVKTTAPGAARSSGWARVAAAPTASRGENCHSTSSCLCHTLYLILHVMYLSVWSCMLSLTKCCCSNGTACAFFHGALCVHHA